MSQKILTKNTALPQQVNELKREVHSLRSFLNSWVGKDKEGEYRPAFVRRIAKATQEKPTLTFKNPKSFLDDIKKV